MDSEPRLAGRISKQINVFVQFAHFNNIDMFQKGLYQLQCRLYAAPRDPSRRRRRVDALPIETLPGEGHSASTPLPTFLSETSKELRYNCFPTHFAKRTSCPVHPLKKCSWRCRTDGPSNLHNVWVSKSFYISRVNEQVTLHHGAVFSFDLDAIVSDGGDATSISDEGGKTSDAYLEVELWFTADEGMTNPEDFEYQQGRRFRLSNLLSPSASTRLHQYAGVSYSGTFFSSCSFVVSTCVIGYRFSGQPPVRRSNSRLGSSDRLIYLSLPNLWKKISEWPRDLAQENDSTGSLWDSLSRNITGTLNYLVSGPSDGRVPTADKLMETWTMYANLLVHNLELALDCFANVAESYPSSLSFDVLDEHAALSALQIRNLFARALNVDWSVNDPWDAATSDLLDLEDRLRFLDTSDTLIKEFTMSGRSAEVIESTLIDLIHGTADMVREVWRDFLRGAAMLPMTEISMKRAAWGRSYISMLRKHILPPSAVGDLNQVKQYVRSITHQHRASSKSLVIEDNPKPIPIIINHTTPTGYFERPGTPISLNQPARSPSISTSVFSESFWPLSSGHEIDDDASVRGLMSPRSVKSDGGGGGTPGVSEHYDAYTRAIERGLQDTTQFRGRHLIVFVHGLLGSAWDFRLYKNKILLARHNLGLPCNDIVFLNSNSNEEDTFDDISTLADNLVSEIVEFVEMEMIRVDRLSFVCHSLGGIIARCAIEKPLMATFYDKYNTFTTFATPHLSIGVTNNRLLAMLASMYQYIDKSPCVDQLLLRDAQDKRDSFLYKQAMRTTALGHFKRVRLLAAAQDGYAGLGSALILDSGHGRLRPGSGEQSWWKCQPFPCIPNGSPQQRPDPTSPMSPMSPLPVATVDMAYDEMLSALSNTLSHMRVERYVVWFPTLVRKTDVLGRQAHIAILDDPMMLEMAGLLGKFHL